MSKERQELIEYLKTEGRTDAQIAQMIRPSIALAPGKPPEELIAETIADLTLLKLTDDQIAEMIKPLREAHVEASTLEEPEAETRHQPDVAPRDATLKEMMTIAEAAAYLGISIDALYNRIEKFKIPVFWLADHWRLDKSKLNELRGSRTNRR